jgi:hypothetical protein
VTVCPFTFHFSLFLTRGLCRNLFATDYLKDRDMMSEQLRRVWEALGDDICQVNSPVLALYTFVNLFTGAQAAR